MLREKYFDNAATTPLDPRVLEAMLPWLGEHWGNANSIHSLGLEARAAVEKARQQVALAIGADDPSEIVFTSGATEANNWLLAAHPGAWISPVEHSSIWEQVKPRGLRIFETVPDYWMNDRVQALEPLDGLVSLMRVNNETGAIYPVPLGEIVHVDATQMVGKLYFRVNLDGPPMRRELWKGEIDFRPEPIRQIDYATFSAHKFHGPKGVGALYARGANFPPPILMGGEQEEGYRAGTLNVPAIVGMGAAIQLTVDEEHDGAAGEPAYIQGKMVLKELEGLPDWHQNGRDLPPGLRADAFPPGISVSPFILSLSFLGVEGESLVIEMDRRGYAISSGAACSSRSTEPSHVLTALGYPTEWLRGTVRISFGRFNTLDETVSMARSLRESVESLRRLGR